MKVLVLILGILGSLASIGLGVKWVKDYQANKGNITQVESLSAQMGVQDQVKSEMQDLDKMVKAAYAMIALGGLAFLASLFVFKIPKVTGLILIVAAAAPAVLVPISLIFTGLMGLAGLIAIFLKAKPKPSIV